MFSYIRMFSYFRNGKFIFFGTPDFAATILRKLLAVGFAPAAVVANPDKPSGRGQKTIEPVAVKRELEKFQVPRQRRDSSKAASSKFKVLQPSRAELKSESFADQIKLLHPDFFIVAAYGNIIPESILKIPKLGALGVHPSLLPEARGAWPIQYAILKRLEETGSTIFLLDEEVDHGQVIIQQGGVMVDRKYYQELYDELAELSAALLIKALPDFLNGKIIPRAQDHSKATYCQLEPGRWNIKKEDGLIDWHQSAEEVDRKVRAFHIWPGAYTFWNGVLLKIYKGEPQNIKLEQSIMPGTVIAQEDKLLVECARDRYIVESLQLAGGKIFGQQNMRAFLNGHKDLIGAVLNV